VQEHHDVLIVSNMNMSNEMCHNRLKGVTEAWSGCCISLALAEAPARYRSSFRCRGPGSVGGGLIDANRWYSAVEMFSARAVPFRAFFSIPSASGLLVVSQGLHSSRFHGNDR
jgi:hypothetical protein